MTPPGFCVFEQVQGIRIWGQKYQECMYPEMDNVAGATDANVPTSVFVVLFHLFDLHFRVCY